MKAVGNNVIIKQDPIQRVSEHGIVLSAELNPTQDTQNGTVVSIGQGKISASGKVIPIDPDIKVGARVAYTSRTIIKNGEKYNPNEVEEPDAVYVIVDADDIIGAYE